MGAQYHVSFVDSTKQIIDLTDAGSGTGAQTLLGDKPKIIRNSSETFRYLKGQASESARRACVIWSSGNPSPSCEIHIVAELLSAGEILTFPEKVRQCRTSVVQKGN